MPFNVLTIRSGLNTGDDALYPMLSDASCHEVIALDDYDGPNGQRLVATAVQVLQIHDGGLKTLVRLRDVSIDVYITDGRVAWTLSVAPERRLAVRAVLAWDALAKQSPGRLRPCANDECRLFLIDRTRNNTARWCSMAVCGNRLKARRHYQRARPTGR